MVGGKFTDKDGFNNNNALSENLGNSLHVQMNSINSSSLGTEKGGPKKRKKKKSSKKKASEVTKDEDTNQDLLPSLEKSEARLSASIMIEKDSNVSKELADRVSSSTDVNTPTITDSCDSIGQGSSLASAIGAVGEEDEVKKGSKDESRDDKGAAKEAAKEAVGGAVGGATAQAITKDDNEDLGRY